MGTLFAELKKDDPDKPKAATRKPRGPIPIASLNQLSCRACPRDKMEDKLSTPKMLPDGSESPLIYFLADQPTILEDKKGEHWSSPAAREVVSRMQDKRGLRFGAMVQCADADGLQPTPSEHEIECCRLRAVSDIERSKPLVVVGMGGDVLHWATGLGRNAHTFRGTLIATKIGSHVCWFYPVLYPKFIHDNRRGSRVDEFELTLGHDIAYIEQAIEDGLEPPTVYDAPYDGGIELITGSEPNDFQRLEDALHKLVNLPAVAYDIETNGLRPYLLKDPHIWTAAVGTFEHTVAFPLDHPEGWGTETRMRRAHSLLAEFLLQSGRKRCHNVAMEMEWSSYFYGTPLLRMTEWDDTMAMAHTIDERKGTKKLDVQTRIHFGFNLKEQSPVKTDDGPWIERYSLREVLRYNGMDTKWCDKLATLRLPVVNDTERSRGIYEGYMRLAPTLVLTTAVGLPVDFDYAERIAGDIEKERNKVHLDLMRTPDLRKWQAARLGVFEVENTHHVLKLMKDVLKRPEVIKTDKRTGDESDSTDKTVLAQMPDDEVPSAALILLHRELNRNLTTYLGPILERKLTGAGPRLHAEYSALHVDTGRLSSTMHNWPKRKHKEVRGAIAAGPDEWIVACDYGQIEFRVAGMLSGDPKLIEYIWTGYDVHMYWAGRLVDEYPKIKRWIERETKKDWEEGGIKELRQMAKNRWVFPQLFGATTQSCAANLGDLPLTVAEYLGAEFWREFAGVKEWQERTVRDYQRNLYSETLGGFRRRGPLRLNQIINAPIQGTAAEIVLAGMTALSERSQVEDDPDIHPVFNGHDDLTFIVRDEHLADKIDIIVHEMCKHRFDYINVPLMIEVSVGARWHEMEEIAKHSSVDVYGLHNPYAKG